MDFETYALLKNHISKLSDEKVSNPKTAEVGQILEVEEVDENGKPTKWKCVDNPAVLTIPQELTDEQKAQARANIDEYEWRTCADVYGTYTYAIYDNTVDYDIAKNTLNTSGNGALNALEDIVSWSFYLIGAHIPEIGKDICKGIVDNFDALKQNGALRGNSIVIVKPSHLCQGTGAITINKINRNGATHSFQFKDNNIVCDVLYNKDTDTIVECSSYAFYITKSFTKAGLPIDAKVVGDKFEELSTAIIDLEKNTIKEIIFTVNTDNTIEVNGCSYTYTLTDEGYYGIEVPMAATEFNTIIDIMTKPCKVSVYANNEVDDCQMRYYNLSYSTEFWGLPGDNVTNFLITYGNDKGIFVHGVPQ